MRTILNMSMMLFFLFIGSQMSYAQISQTPWQEINIGVQNHPTNLGIANSPFVGNANLVRPAANAPNWAIVANGNQAGAINLIPFGASVLQTCTTQVDYTFFQSFITIPAGVNPTGIRLDAASTDDHCRIEVFDLTGNMVSQAFESISNGFSVNDILQGVQVADVDRCFRVVITHADICATGIGLEGVQIKDNNEANPFLKSCMACVESDIICEGFSSTVNVFFPIPGLYGVSWELNNGPTNLLPVLGLPVTDFSFVVPASLLTAVGSPHDLTVLTNDSLCFDTVNTTIVVNPNPGIEINMNTPIVVCEGEDATLTATAVGTNNIAPYTQFTWNVFDNIGAIVGASQNGLNTLTVSILLQVMGHTR